MASRDLAMNLDGTRIRVKGLDATLKAIRRAGEGGEDMQALMVQIGSIVAATARTLVPKEEGRLAATIRHGRGKTKAVVKAGTARLPYGGVRHYGTPDGKRDRLGRPMNQAPSLFLLRALDVERSRVTELVERGIADLLRKHHLV